MRIGCPPLFPGKGAASTPLEMGRYQSADPPFFFPAAGCSTTPVTSSQALAF